jgi:hypothetical protein
MAKPTGRGTTRTPGEPERQPPEPPPPDLDEIRETRLLAEAVLRRSPRPRSDRSGAQRSRGTSRCRRR